MDVVRSRAGSAAVGKMAMLFLVAIAFVAVASALLPPAAPGLPSDPLPSSATTVSISSPAQGATVNSSTAVVYQHNAGRTLECSLYIDANPPINATVDVTKTENVVLANGTHAMNVTCRNATMAISSPTVSVTAVNATGNSITMIYPVDSAPPTLNVSYRHNVAAGSVNCTVRFDGGAPKHASGVLPNTVVSASYANLPLGSHVFEVNCTNGAWSGGVRRNVNITNTTVAAPELLTISPKNAIQGDTVTMNATIGDAYTDVDVVVEDPDALPNVTVYNTGAFGRLRARYVLPLNAKIGTYSVAVIRQDDDTMILNGTFNVSKRVATVKIAGNATTIPAGVPVVVLGERFPPDDNISLTLVGSGTVVNSTVANSVGEFTYIYYNLTPKKYDLTVKSVSQPTVMLTVSFNVTPVNATAAANATNTTNTTVIGPGNASNSTGVIDLIEIETEVEEQPLIEYEPEPEPYNYPEPNVDGSTGGDDGDDDGDADGGSSGGGMRWLIFIIAFVVIVGGVAGYLVYNGTLDLSSPDAFKESVGALFSGGTPPKQEPSVIERPTNAFGDPIRASAPVGTAEGQTIKSFIYSERSKGFDDLTIRGALIGRGWDKTEVDAMFDQIYKDQNGP